MRNVPPCVPRNPPCREMSISKTTQDFHSQDKETLLAESIAQLVFHMESTCKHKITMNLLPVINNSVQTIFNRSSHFSLFEYITIYIIYTPSLGLEITAFVREREQGRFKSSTEGAPRRAKGRSIREPKIVASA